MSCSENNLIMEKSAALIPGDDSGGLVCTLRLVRNNFLVTSEKRTYRRLLLI